MVRPSRGGSPVSVDCENLDVKFMGPHRIWQSQSGIVILGTFVHSSTARQTINGFGRKKIPKINRRTEMVRNGDLTTIYKITNNSSSDIYLIPGSLTC